MPGIYELYTMTATNHIKGWAKKPHKISRSKIELALLQELDKAPFPIETKIAWYNAVLTSDDFDFMWIGAQKKYSLSKAAVARYVPKEALCNYSPDDYKKASDEQAKADASSSGDASIHPSSTPVTSTSKESSSTLQDTDDDDDEPMEEVWYGAEGEAERDRLAACEAKERMERKQNASKAKPATIHSLPKPRASKVTQARKTKK